MNALVHVPFQGGEVLAVEIDGRPHVVLKPAVEALGIDYRTQYRKLQGKSWAAMGTVPTTGADGKTYRMVAVDVRTFLMLLATIDEHRVAEDARPLLAAYQSEVADAIEAYFTQGAALNPRATHDQLMDVIHRAEGQAGLLQRLRGIVDPKWLEAKARHVAARALGEEPEVEFDSRPLTIGQYLEEHGVRASIARRVAPTLGKAVKAAFRAEHGSDPALVPRFIDGAMRQVCAYTESDRPLFDRAWQALDGGS